MKRILIIEVNWVGDVLFTTPAIRAIRQHNPDSFIAALVVGRCAEMLEGNPHINEIIPFEEDGAHRGIIGKISLILALRSKGFDTVISFHRSMSRMLMCALAGIPRRIGYYTKKRSWLLSDPVDMPKAQPHRVEYFLNIVRPAGIDTENKDYEFFVPDESIASADEILEANGIAGDEEFFIINPGGNWPPKRWLKENFARLCEGLKSRYGKKILITGARKDEQLGWDIVGESNNSAISICAKTNLKELAAIMRKAALVIANDSGPMHIAVSQKTPVVTLFGPTLPAITGPYGTSEYIVLHEWDECDIPCYDMNCEDYRCMKAISVDDVLAAAERLIKSK
ncbi:MAG: lipopolysaccharide heptosyltransferase II [Candidatus Omnitrophica bacterium]|nr:lipopolysaccharide heptosyltransferase II [Candidatus Omnitrophota bacterium]